MGQLNEIATSPYAIGHEVFGDIGDCCVDTIADDLLSLCEGQNIFCKCGTSFKSHQVDKQKVNKTIVQTLIFSKSTFSEKGDATEWARDHSFKAGKVDETDKSFRLRQRTSKSFMKDSFRTITLTKGVKAVIGKLKTKKSPEEFENEVSKNLHSAVIEKEVVVGDYVVKATRIEHKGITKESAGHVHSFDLYTTIGPDGKPLNGIWGFTDATSDGSEHFHEIDNFTETKEGGEDGHTHAIELPVNIVEAIQAAKSAAAMGEDNLENKDKVDVNDPAVAAALADLFSTHSAAVSLATARV